MVIYAILTLLAAALAVGAVTFARRLSRERQRNSAFSTRIAVELQLVAAKAGPMRDREFRIAFAQQSDATAAASAARKNAYRVTVRHDESRGRWIVAASRRMTDSAAETTTAYFEQLANRHRGEYEGSTAGAEAPSS
jgi:hypothetical protein